jgi:hypothetical protein
MATFAQTVLAFKVEAMDVLLPANVGLPPLG